MNSSVDVYEMPIPKNDPNGLYHKFCDRMGAAKSIQRKRFANQRRDDILKVHRPDVWERIKVKGSYGYEIAEIMKKAYNTESREKTLFYLHELKYISVPR